MTSKVSNSIMGTPSIQKSNNSSTVKDTFMSALPAVAGLGIGMAFRRIGSIRASKFVSPFRNAVKVQRNLKKNPINATTVKASDKRFQHHRISETNKTFIDTMLTKAETSVLTAEETRLIEVNPRKAKWKQALKDRVVDITTHKAKVEGAVQEATTARQQYKKTNSRWNTAGIVTSVVLTSFYYAASNDNSRKSDLTKGINATTQKIKMGAELIHKGLQEDWNKLDHERFYLEVQIQQLPEQQAAILALSLKTQFLAADSMKASITESFDKFKGITERSLQEYSVEGLPAETAANMALGSVRNVVTTLAKRFKFIGAGIQMTAQMSGLEQNTVYYLATRIPINVINTIMGGYLENGVIKQDVDAIANEILQTLGTQGPSFDPKETRKQKRNVDLATTLTTTVATSSLPYGDRTSLTRIFVGNTVKKVANSCVEMPKDLKKDELTSLISERYEEPATRKIEAIQEAAKASIDSQRKHLDEMRVMVENEHRLMQEASKAKSFVGTILRFFS